MPSVLVAERPDAAVNVAAEGRRIPGQIPQWITPVLLFLSMVRLVIRQSHKPNLLTSFTDDCYYYLVVARNIATGHGQTFGGISYTNGFHPLWGYMLAGCALFGSSFHHFFFFISAIIVVATLATFLLARAILTVHCDAVFAEAFALAISAYCAHLYLLGMEIILTIPLLLALLLVLERTTRHSGKGRLFLIGLLAALAVLSRLDTLLLVAFMAGLCFLLIDLRRARGLPAKAAALALGFLPLVMLYVISNQVFFHTWLPISGMAKHLKWTHTPSLTPWQDLLILVPRYLTGLDALALLVLPWMFIKLAPRQRALWTAVIVFPWAHVLIVSCLSDWPLDRWYSYSFAFALCPIVALLYEAAMALVGRFPEGFRSASALASLLALGIWLGGFAWQFSSRYWPPSSTLTVAGATALERFALTHPGVYAVGDRAGVIGFLIPDPIVQLEGLMMDRDFLTHIQRQEDLRSVLSKYGVRYYVANPFLPIHGCIEASEPIWAGPQSPHMTSEFCEAPVSIFRNPADFRIQLVYDLASDPQPWSAPGPAVTQVPKVDGNGNP